ncbi:DUF7079 family protein [Zooshikella sp. RANM57]|uniref:DUF7079 family protein n=1 Tax=Zooshikella sp. RANM57 TaxID=3425863 RepID=UPI003D6FFF31
MSKGFGVRIVTTDELYTAWLVISDLFLDTELKSSDIKFIARRLAETPFSEEQLTAFYLYDIAPVCYINAFPPGGEWGGFDEEWLVSSILNNRTKNQKLQRFKCKLFKRFYLMGTYEDWLKVLEHITELRKTPRE